MPLRGSSNDYPLFIKNVGGGSTEPASNVQVQGTDPNAVDTTALHDVAVDEGSRSLFVRLTEDAIGLATEATLAALKAVNEAIRDRLPSSLTAAGNLKVAVAEDGVGLATEATLGGVAKETTLASIDGKDFATETTLATRASEATLQQVRNAQFTPSAAAEWVGSLTDATTWVALNPAAHGTTPLTRWRKWLIVNRGSYPFVVGYGAQRKMMTVKPGESVSPPFGGTVNVKGTTANSVAYEVVAFGEA